MTLSRKLASLAIITMVVGLTQSGCGDNDDAPSSGGPAKTATSSSGVLTKADFIDRMESAIGGAGSAHATISIDSSGQSLTGEGDLIFGATADQSAMDFEYDAGEVKFQLRVVDSLIYINYGRGTDNKFFKIDPNDADNPLAKQFSGLLDQMDPAASYEPLKKAIKSVRQRAGAPRIGGVRTNSYEVVVDTDKIADLPGLEDVPKDELPETFTYVFYLDKDDLVRKISFELEGSVMVMKYSDFGKMPLIKAPSASEITTTPPFSSSI